MKRKQFVSSLIVGGIAPLTALCGSRRTDIRTDNGFVVKSGEARNRKSFKLKGVNSNILDVKISGDDTNGGFALFEQTSVTQGKGTPLHVHHKQDEVFYVVEGEYYFQIGDEKFRAFAGDTIFLPMKVPHAWTQVSPKGKMTVLFQPAGKMESFFTSTAALNHEPSKEEMSRIFEENEMTVVGPPLKVD
ncbi:MAG TPA: cupin domain-containing protein [Cyclobacteriaceae bacterium]|nr:cupin domain-containing protein [Cyclobacteriaceae bacterium]